MLFVRWSETIQYRNRTLLVPVLRVEHSKLCPLSEVVHAFKLAGVLRSTEHDLGPAFTYQKNGALTPLTYSVFTDKLKLSLNKCGIDNTKYSGHSFRRGGATFAQSCGVPGTYIKLQGDWRSNAYERYLDCSLQYKLAAVNMMSKAITHS